MNKPNFLFIGGQRCGSSWIYKCLKEHPDVFVSEKKEVHFFNKNYDRGLDWYHDFFEDVKGAKASGEITPNYLSVAEVPKRVHAYDPEMKLICCLRNPVERTISAYTKHRNSSMKGFSLLEAAKTNLDGILDMGDYHRYLQKWLNYFPRENIYIALYDDLVQDDKKFIQDLFRFLGVNDDVVPSCLGKTENAILYPGVQDYLTKFHLMWVKEAVKKTPLNAWLRRVSRKGKKNSSSKPSQGDQDDIKFLYDYFRESNTDLQDFLGRELTGWIQ